MRPLLRVLASPPRLTGGGPLGRYHHLLDGPRHLVRALPPSTLWTAEAPYHSRIGPVSS